MVVVINAMTIIILITVIIAIIITRHLPPPRALPGYLLTDAGGESPLLLLDPLTAEVTDIFFSARKSVVGHIGGWVQRKKEPESQEESFDENERFVDL